MEGRRIAVTTEVFSRLTEEAEGIRKNGKHFKVNEAKLATAIINIFFKRYLEKERERLKNLFLDKKVFLKSLIEKSGSEDELNSSISTYLRASKSKLTRKKKDDQENHQG